MSLLNVKGRLGFILPHKFFNAQYGRGLRNLISEGKNLAEVVHFGEQQVFVGATTYTCLLFLNKAKTSECRFVKATDLIEWQKQGSAIEGQIPSASITEAEWNFMLGKETDLQEEFNNLPLKLGDIAHTFVGTQTSADDVFVLENCCRVKKYIKGISKTLNREVSVEADIAVPFLRGKDIRRYSPLLSDSFLICPYEISEDHCRLFSASEMSDKFPKALSYLEENKSLLAEREKGKFKGSNWYAFGYPKSMTLFQKTKIVVPDYNNISSFTIDSTGYFYKTGYGILLKQGALSPEYILGLLNSKLLFSHLMGISTHLRGGYVKFWTQYIEQLPIRNIIFTNLTDKVRYNQMISLVEQMLDLHKHKVIAKDAAEQEKLQRMIESTDKQIDALVYELYELTPEEIAIVEGSK